ncbi:MAG: hypothetical protein KDB79_02495 [Acidobacteria bacterium]|nr:hypothetical protein [Acidobacteriota bacterium]
MKIYSLLHAAVSILLTFSAADPSRNTKCLKDSEPQNRSNVASVIAERL